MANDMQAFRMTCTGTRPLLVHNVRLASPMNPYAKALKALNSKRSKTDEDRVAIAKVEFEGSLYFDEEIGPYLPGGNLLASITEGAKIKRAGRKVERGVTVVEFELPLVYKGPRDLAGLWGNGESEYVDIRPVTVQSSKVDRCRPIFRDWLIEATVVVDKSAIDIDEFKEVAGLAGKMAGLGDYRKQFGRYAVELEETTL